MAGPNQQAIAVSRLVSSTRAHVLRLVAASYLDGAGPSTQAYRRLAKQASSSRSSVPMRRFASSASALAEGPDVGLPVVLTPKKGAKADVPLSSVPVPKWAAMPRRAEAELFFRRPKSAADFIERFKQAGCSPGFILPYRRVCAVVRVFCTEGFCAEGTPPTPEDWQWLASTLSDAKEQVSTEGKGWAADDLPLSQGPVYCLFGLALAHTGEWKTAVARMATGLRVASQDGLKMSSEPSYLDALPQGVVPAVQAFVTLAREAGRATDVATVVWRSSGTLRKTLTGLDSTRPDTHDVHELRVALQAALADVADPFGWVTEQLALAGPNLAAALYTTANAFLAALLASPARTTGEAYSLWRNITQEFNSTFVPAHVAAELAQRLSEQGSVAAAREVLARMREKWATLPHSALSVELRIAANEGNTAAAQGVWLDLTARYGPSRSDKLAFALAYAMNGDVESTEEMLFHLLGNRAFDGADALAVMQRACQAVGDLDRAHEYLRRAARIEPTLEDFQSLLTRYASRGDTDQAVRLFDEMIHAGVRPTTRAYTSLISAFAQVGDYSNADLMFEGMVRAGFMPDAISYSAVINAALEAGNWDHAAVWCDRVPKKMLGNEKLASTLMKAFVLIHAPLEVTLRQFREVAIPGERMWALAMQAAADHDDLVMVQALFEEMDARSKLDYLSPPPNVYVFSILLGTFIRSGDRAMAKATYDAMVARKIIPSSVTYGLLTASFADAPGTNSFEQGDNFARTVYDHLSNTRNQHVSEGEVAAHIFRPLIAAAGRSGEMALARRYYDMVNDKGGNSIYLTTVLMDAYRRAGQTKMVYRLWCKTFRNALRTIPRRSSANTGTFDVVRSRNNLLCIPLSVTLQAFMAAGRHDRIQALWRDVRRAGFGFDAQNYNHLVRGLAVTGDVESAFRVVEHVLIPRWDQVRSRQYRAMREEAALQAVDAEAMSNAREEPDLTHAEVGAAASAPPPAVYPPPLASPFDARPRPQFGLRADYVPGQPPLPPPHPQPPAPELEPQEPHEPERPPVEVASVFTSADVATPSRTPNRRAELQAYTPPEFMEGNEAEDMRSVDLSLLRYWRPTDVLWRPSKKTVAILEQAYRQLEEQRAYRAWVGVGTDEEPEEHGPVVLPEFNHAVAKNPDSSVDQRSPGMILARLGRYYAKTVGLVMLYRRKQEYLKKMIEQSEV